MIALICYVFLKFLNLNDYDYEIKTLDTLEPLESLDSLESLKLVEDFEKSSKNGCHKEEMLMVVGKIMAGAGQAVRSLVCDAHGSHRLIKHSLLGLHAAKPGIPFFGELDYQPLPATCVQNLSYQAPFYDEEVILFLAGPNHLQKNIVGAMRSFGFDIFYFDSTFLSFLFLIFQLNYLKILKWQRVLTFFHVCSQFQVLILAPSILGTFGPT